MVAINLLNWREKRRLVLNARFYVITGIAVVFCIIFALFVYLLIGNMIASQEENVEYLSVEIKGVETKIKEIKDLEVQRDLLLNRRKVIESVQDSRSFVVKLFDNFARVIPDGIVVTELSRKGNELIVRGSSDSNEDISEMMKSIQRLKWVVDAKLGEIKTSTEKEQVQANPQNTGKGKNKDKNAQQPAAALGPKTKIDFELRIAIDPAAAGG